MKKRKITITLITIILTIFTSCKADRKKNLSTKKDKIKETVEKWNLAHNERDYSLFENLYSQNKVEFYQKKSSDEECIDNKQKLFEKYPDFYQQINGKIEIISLDSNKFKTTFIKQVTISGKTIDYPSYLILEENNEKIKIITEGDYITDKNLKKKTLRKTENKNEKDKLESFINGLKNPKIYSLNEVSNGIEYKLNYSNEQTKPILKIKRNNKKLELSINYNNNIQTVLPFEFYSTFHGSGSHRELRKESKDDEYMIGQHDFDHNGVDEIVVALKSKFKTTESYGVHFYVYRYLSLAKINNNYSIENWRSYGDYETWEVLGGTKVKIKDNKISTIITSDGDLFEEWIFDNGEFTKSGQI